MPKLCATSFESLQKVNQATAYSVSSEKNVSSERVTDDSWRDCSKGEVLRCNVQLGMTVFRRISEFIDICSFFLQACSYNVELLAEVRRPILN